MESDSQFLLPPAVPANTQGRCAHIRRRHLQPPQPSPGIAPRAPGASPGWHSPAVPLCRCPRSASSGQGDLSRAGSAAGQPRREKAALAALISAWGGTAVGWQRGMARGSPLRDHPAALVGNESSGRLSPARCPAPTSSQLWHTASVHWETARTCPTQKGAFPAKIVSAFVSDPAESEALLVHRITL